MQTVLSDTATGTAKEELTRPEVGQRITVRIDDVAFGGEGVGRVNGFVVFVPLVIEGEAVEARITEVKKKFARAELVEIVEPAESRIAPACDFFGDCGGCQYQHIAYEAQLTMKRKQVAALFGRIGGFSEDRVAPVVACPQPFNYRNRILIRSQWNGKAKKLLVGFRKRNSHWVVEVDDCKIAEPALNAQIPEVRNNPPNKGGVKVNLRVAPEEWMVPDHSFFQTNYFMLPRMVEILRRMFQISGSEYLIDAYCGVGFLGIELAGLAKRYAGVEYDHRAILAARKNAAKFGGDNGEFIEGRTENLLPELLTKFSDGNTTVILDPPRKGCATAALGQLREIRPAQIIYVSCHPATLARDLNTLCADGVYRLEQVVPLDMFPHTQHVECVTDLRLNTST
ncbi:MAG: class I SAM-dependent RNA methyltransferase [Verrucomicrobiota bacterium]|nr:class I SAM-dependent RNA methyltransferase [Verrucomicrobiota bacterium]